MGAGQPPSSGADRQREGFSSFGSRIDLQGWGSGVVTTGYGDLYRAPDRLSDPGFWYTGGFNGTSTGSPQLGNTAEPIGPRPNLLKAAAHIPCGGPCDP